MARNEVVLEGSSSTLQVDTLIKYLHRRGDLAGLLRRAFVEDFIVRSAIEAGIVATVAELQHAADLYRRRRGLRTAAATHRWLESRHLSPAQFEARIERWLLAEKLKDHVTANDIENAFSKRRAEFDAVGIRQAIMPTQDAAKEMLERLHEGVDFSTAARLFASPAAMAKAFEVAQRFRRELSAAIAERAFAAGVGTTIGPFADAEGFSLIRIEIKTDAMLDARTCSVLRDELFANWLAQRLDQPIRFPLLETLDSQFVAA
ncbi:MAG: peptidyl-prolyl cis-trans isomerase [Gemmataceae bacterium]